MTLISDIKQIYTKATLTASKILSADGDENGNGLNIHSAYFLAGQNIFKCNLG